MGPVGEHEPLIDIHGADNDSNITTGDRGDRADAALRRNESGRRPRYLTVPTGVIYGLLVPTAPEDDDDPDSRHAAASDDGVARVFGHDVVRDGQLPRSTPSSTGQENLVLLGRLLGLRARARGRGARETSPRGLRAGARAGG